MQPTAEGRPLGKVTGVGEVRDKDGNLKGTILIEGYTHLTEEELRRRMPELPLESNKSEDK